MAKLIRPTYPPAFSFGLLILIFLLSCFLSHQIFDVPFSKSFEENEKVYFGMILVGAAVIIMILILWEEILFPIKVKEINGEVIFRNHRTKLKAQMLMYCFIPAIFIFI
ncbi:MAG: heavy metal transporter, partial [Cytophagaceae bacterium]